MPRFPLKKRVFLCFPALSRVIPHFSNILSLYICTMDNGDRLNVCANYDIATGQVCNELEISLHHSDGSEEDLSYALNPTEKELLRRKMETYCQQQTGLSMEDYSAQIMEEEMSGPSGPAM